MKPSTYHHCYYTGGNSMRIPLPNRLMTLLTAAVGISGAGCTKNPDESTRLESAAAVAPPAQQPAGVEPRILPALPSHRRSRNTPRGVKPARRKPVVEPASPPSQPAAPTESAPAAAGRSGEVALV